MQPTTAGSQLVLLDLSSAFDTVDHDCLLSVLNRRFANDSLPLDWFRSYPSERMQTFTTADGRTDRVAVTCGIPQGSVMGPGNIIAYIEDAADLPHSRRVAYHLFADDKQLHTSAMHLVKKLSVCKGYRVASLNFSLLVSK